MVSATEVEDIEIEGVEPNPEYVCITKCYVKGRLLKVGDKIRLTGEEKFIKYFKEASKVSAVEETEDSGPETLSEIAKLEAQKVIDDLKGTGQGPGNEDAPSGPVDGASAAEDFLS